MGFVGNYRNPSDGTDESIDIPKLLDNATFSHASCISS